jgi:hypothetical protein
MDQIQRLVMRKNITHFSIKNCNNFLIEKWKITKSKSQITKHNNCKICYYRFDFRNNEN